MLGKLELIPLSKEFFKAPFAHRGFHDCCGNFGSGKTENSMMAFEAAVYEGFGIEIDIQLSSDNVPMVFHDSDLKRLTNRTDCIRGLSARNLEKILLPNGEPIPKLFEFLDFVSGKVPILVELKDQDGSLGPNVGVLETQVAKALKNYPGPVAVMSFNPHSVMSFGRALPSIPRGLVTDKFLKVDWPEIDEDKLRDLRHFKNIKELAVSFISHNHLDLGRKEIEMNSSDLTVFSWTIKNESDSKKALKRSDNITFEGFHPKKK
jgi:glycerophosphoryl diester phosphodiesterase